MNKTQNRGILCALIGGILWGCSGTVGQHLFSQYSISSEWLTSVRMICAGLILLLVSGIQKAPMKQVWKKPRDRYRLIAFSVFGLMSVQLTYMKAIFYSNSATATALQFLGQAFILLTVCVQELRLPKRRESIGLCLAIAGIFLLSTHGSIHSLALSKSALFWGLGAAMSVVLYTMLPIPLIGTYGSIPITGYGMLIGGSVLALFTQAWSHFPTLDFMGWIYVAWIIIFGSALAFALYLQGVSDAGSVLASLFACSEPVCAALLTTFWLKTPLLLSDYIAFALILGMAILLSFPQKNYDKTP